MSRPNPYQLSPIEFRQDTRNVFRGNPELRAEYTNAIEVGYQESRSWGSIQLSPYLRSTAHAVRNIQFVDSTGVSVSTFDNVASTLTVGRISTSTRTRVRCSSAAAEASITTRATHRISGQSVGARDGLVGAHERHLEVLAEGRRADVGVLSRAVRDGRRLAARVGIDEPGGRYKVWGDQGNISLRVSDPFKLQKYGYRTANGTVVEYSERFFGSRAVFLTITRNFGQAIKLQPKQPDPDAQAADGTTARQLIRLSADG